MSGKTELTAYRHMLRAVNQRIGGMVQQGKSREEVIAAKPTMDLDEKWRGGSMKPDEWVGIVYDGMTQK
ncbi:MAG: hypothetical protein GY778_11255 [bacterium]|nr:hypothetical protein [bacterium]